ncbi:7-deoxyloganetin glucosyltransferase [Dichanthelium oligosanthes]|uniref:7-deoxyloganetin glucosyltransferase n=1 Tax=Dichanthelium oligosanthes TaxID=888268 RepID=A0A1E5WKH1_9POAL|nr:7-deoxyloganetin glucosyltransferase [Dichanthelium oligosanthes]
MARPHAVVVPYPFSGNINPALQLSKLLHRHGVFITFVITEHNLCRVQAAAAKGAMTSGREGFRIETIPAGMLDAYRDAQDYGLSLSKATIDHGAAPLRELVARLRDGSVAGAPAVTCVLPTSLMSFALDVARELGVPSMVLLGFGAAALMAQMRLRELKERGYLPLKEPGSVVYVNFGSHTVLTADQLAEFAWGLAATGHPFLLVVREDLVHGTNGRSMAALTPELLAETEGRCRVATWCPQERVLRHRAVGCFLTHCGWNSMLESIAAGVPVAGQYEEVKREQVAGRVREAMESEEMRKSAARWKAEVEAAACPGGSSYENLLSLVKALEETSLNSEE